MFNCGITDHMNIVSYWSSVILYLIYRFFNDEWDEGMNTHDELQGWEIRHLVAYFKVLSHPDCAWK
jgi:hypothetical protein